MSSLKDLNLKEVSTKTQLEMDFLNAVVNKDFKKLEKFNVRGFLKILSREYELDFTEFLEEYEAFLSEESGEKKSANNEKEVYIPPQIDAYSAPSGSKSWLYILILALLIGAAWAAYKYDLLNLLLENNASSSQTAVIDIIEVKNNAPEASSNATNLAPSTQDNLAQNSADTLAQSSAQDLKLNAADNANTATNHTNSNALNSTTSNSTNSNSATPAAPQEESLELVIAPSESNQSAQSEEEALSLNDTIASLSENLKKEALFNTKGKVWVGFIDLKTQAKTTRVTDSNFSVDLSKDQLILAGATELSVVDENGEQKSYPAGTSKRFLVQNGHIKPISLGEFKALNKGKEW